VSQENVAIVRRFNQAWNDRDRPTLEALLTEDYVLRLIGGFDDMMGSEFRGLAAASGWMRDFVETLGVTSQIEEIREVGDRVLEIGVGHGLGAGSQAHTTRRYATVHSFQDGKISGADVYYSVEAALKAVGLEE
jgi:ketosteroid isomerase-like protein